MTKEETNTGVRKWMRDLLMEEVHFQNRFRKGFLYVVRLLALAGRSFATDLCPQRASALAFTTVLSLVPVTALFVLYFKIAGKLDALSGRAQEWILDTFVAESAQSVAVYIDQFVANMHTKTLGTLGAGGLVVSAYMVFRTIERSLNDIWKVQRHRSVITRLQILSSGLIVIPTLMTASIYISGRFQELKFLSHSTVISSYTRTIFVATPFALTLLTFFLIFKLVPNTNVRWKPAAMAACIASLLFEAAKGGFNFYVVHVISASKIYGTLGLIPVLLIWIYFSWMIILMGVELAFAIQNFELLHEEAKQKFRVHPLDVALHEEWGLKIVRAMIARFLRGEGTLSPDDLARDVGIRASHVLNHLNVLAKMDWAHEVEKNGEIRFVFTRPVHQVTEGEVLNLFRSELKLPALKSGDSEKLLIV